MEVLVADDQLSLSIGKHGQNVRLAAKLTGWKIDIRSAKGEALAEAEAEAAEEPTTDPEKAGAAHEASNPQPTTEEKTA